MENAGYTTLTRQSGLLAEMQTVANNIANISSTGFRKEGVVFSEFIRDVGAGQASLSMATANGRHIDLRQGPLTLTGGRYDFAIEGEGFFLVETPEGQALTRAGSFTPSSEGELVTPDGLRLLDGGGAPIFVPPDARGVSLAVDGTLSADGRPIAQIGVFAPATDFDLTHRGGTLFLVTEEPLPVDGAAILQGYLEDSNVNPVTEIARMIEVQRAYELGQTFLDKEDDRLRSLLQTLGR